MSAYSIVNLKEEVEDSMGERAPGIEGQAARRLPAAAVTSRLLWTTFRRASVC
jgi:hypothetical protein